MALAEAIPAPFDQHLGIDVPDDDPGRQSILATIDSLQAQAELIAAAADRSRASSSGPGDARPDARRRRWLRAWPPSPSPPAAEPIRELLDPASGGDATVEFATRNAFGQPIPGLTDRERRVFEVGDSFFTQNWVTAPVVDRGPGRAGAAAQCPGRARRATSGDGRGAPPASPEDPERGLLVRLSVPGETDVGRRRSPSPSTATSCRTAPSPGSPPEGVVRITHEEIEGTYADGTTYTLSEPLLRASPISPTAPLDAATSSPRRGWRRRSSGWVCSRRSPRPAILDLADPDDADGDGVSGRPNLRRPPGPMSRPGSGGSVGRPTSPRCATR